jgi:hypothetical protein
LLATATEEGTMKKHLVSVGALLALALAACSENRDDFAITSDVRKELAAQKVPGTIEVITVGRVVTLTGTVPDGDAKDKAEDLADDVSGVARVVNNLRTTTAAWAHVLPQQRVEHMARKVEGETLLQLVDGREVALLARLGQLVEGAVRAAHVGGVMLAVMQLENLPRVVRFQGRVVVGQFWQRVGGHAFLLSWLNASNRGEREKTGWEHGPVRAGRRARLTRRALLT